MNKYTKNILSKLNKKVAGEGKNVVLIKKMRLNTLHFRTDILKDSLAKKLGDSDSYEA